MKVFTIIGGVNGTGKSSLSGVLVTTYNDLGAIINPDKLTAELGDKFKGGKAAVKMLNDCLEKGVDFTQETTLSGHQPVSLIKKAKENDYYVRLFYVCVDSLEECLARISNRVKKGGHDIPRELVERRYSKRFDDLLKVIPFCNEVHLFDNENGFREAAEYKNGRLIILLDTPPQWLNELRENLGH